MRFPCTFTLLGGKCRICRDAYRAFDVSNCPEVPGIQCQGAAVPARCWAVEESGTENMLVSLRDGGTQRTRWYDILRFGAQSLIV